MEGHSSRGLAHWEGWAGGSPGDIQRPWMGVGVGGQVTWVTSVKLYVSREPVGAYVGETVRRFGAVLVGEAGLGLAGHSPLRFTHPRLLGQSRIRVGDGASPRGRRAPGRNPRGSLGVDQRSP